MEGELTISQTARILGVSLKTLRRWEKQGKIEAKRSKMGRRIYSREIISKFYPNYKVTSKSMVKIGAAAKILGVSIMTLRRWDKKGKLRATVTPGGTRLYSQEEINLFKKS